MSKWIYVNDSSYVWRADMQLQQKLWWTQKKQKKIATKNARKTRNRKKYIGTKKQTWLILDRNDMRICACSKRFTVMDETWINNVKNAHCMNGPWKWITHKSFPPRMTFFSPPIFCLCLCRFWSCRVMVSEGWSEQKPLFPITIRPTQCHAMLCYDNFHKENWDVSLNSSLF